MAPAGPEDNAARRNFSLRAFAQGLMVVFLVYGGLAGWLWWSAESTHEAQQARLSSKTVLVERPSPPVAYGPPHPSTNVPGAEHAGTEQMDAPETGNDPTA